MLFESNSGKQISPGLRGTWITMQSHKGTLENSEAGMALQSC